MLGKPSAACGTKPTPLSSGIEYAAVDLVGTWLRGGLRFSLTHSSSATKSARRPGDGSVVLQNCWQLLPGPPAGVLFAPETVCSTLDSRQKRTWSGSSS